MDKKIFLMLFGAIIMAGFLVQDAEADVLVISGEDWGTSLINDTFGKSDVGTTPMGALGNPEHVRLTVRDNAAVYFRTVVTADFSALPAGASISKAYWEMTEETGRTLSSGNTAVHHMTGGTIPVNEYTMTWNTQNCGTGTPSTNLDGNCNTTAEDTVSVTTENIAYNWTVTNAVHREWISASTDIGFTIITAATGTQDFYSKEGCSTTNCPRLIIEYELAPPETNNTVFNLNDVGTGSALNGFTVHIDNSTSEYTSATLNSGDSINDNVIPNGAVNVTFVKEGYYNDTFNDTVDVNANSTITGGLWRTQEFKASVLGGSPISSFSVSATNGTRTFTSGLTSNGTLYASLENLPYGTINYTFNAPGFITNNTLFTVSGSSELNSTIFFEQSIFTINGVFDEETLDSLCYNYTIVNETSSSSGSACGAVATNTTLIPTGTNVRVNFQNASYQSRDYYVTVSQSSTISLTGYLLETGSGVQITTFVYSTAESGGIEGALTSALRFINGSYVVVEQKLTDTQGKGFFYLDTFSNYRVTASKDSASATVSSYYPNPSFILYIQLDDASAASNLTWVFDTVAVSFTPTTYYINGIVPMSWTVTATDNDLEYFSLYLNQSSINGTNVEIFSSSVTGSPGGGSIPVNLNADASNASTWIVKVDFKRSSFDEWNTTYIFFPTNFSNPAFVNYPAVIPNTITALQDGGLGFTQSTAQFIVLIIALVVGMVVGKFNQDGGGIVFTVILGVFAWGENPLFPWTWVLLSGIVAIMIVIGRRIP